jgi:RNA polymerase sigma-70 factor (ECF subfamily)
MINGCIDNDRKSQEIFYRHFFPIMERMVRRYTRDEDKIIDIINNGFLKAFKNLDKYEYRGSFEGWLRKIMFHSVSDYMRVQSRDVKYLVFDHEAKEPGVMPDSALYFDDLIRLIETLPDMNMRVFQLYAIEGFSHKEIATLLDINENTSRWYLSEARKELRLKLKKQNKRYRDAG